MFRQVQQVFNKRGYLLAATLFFSQGVLGANIDLVIQDQHGQPMQQGGDATGQQESWQSAPAI